MQIHHRNDEERSLFFGVKNPIWESPNQRPPDLSIKNRSCLWIGDNALNC